MISSALICTDERGHDSSCDCSIWMSEWGHHPFWSCLSIVYKQTHRQFGDIRSAKSYELVRFFVVCTICLLLEDTQRLSRVWIACCAVYVSWCLRVACQHAEAIVRAVANRRSAVRRSCATKGWDKTLRPGWELRQSWGNLAAFVNLHSMHPESLVFLECSHTQAKSQGAFTTWWLSTQVASIRVGPFPNLIDLSTGYIHSCRRIGDTRKEYTYFCCGGSAEVAAGH